MIHQHRVPFHYDLERPKHTQWLKFERIGIGCTLVKLSES